MCPWAETWSSSKGVSSQLSGKTNHVEICRDFFGFARAGSNVEKRDVRVGHPADVVTFLSELPHHLKYRVLAERLAVYRLASDAPFPAWALQEGFFAVVRTDEELSIVCTENACPENVCAEDRLPDGARAERGWIALKLEGPFPFSMTGVLASFLQPLAEAQIPIFAMSTFDTDYVLIKREHRERALAALGAAGHETVGDQVS